MVVWLPPKYLKFSMWFKPTLEILPSFLRLTIISLTGRTLGLKKLLISFANSLTILVWMVSCPFNPIGKPMTMHTTFFFLTTSRSFFLICQDHCLEEYIVATQLSFENLIEQARHVNFHNLHLILYPLFILAFLDDFLLFCQA